MKSIIKNFIKSSGFSLKRIPMLKKEVNKLATIKNRKEKVIELKNLIKKFPKYPNFYYWLARELYYSSDASFFELLNDYGVKRHQWLKETGLEMLDIEFIQYPVFAGSIGNFYALENLIRANNLGLRDKKKLLYILPKRAKFSNSILAGYFEKYVKIIKGDNLDSDIEDFASSLSLPLGLCVPMRKECLYLDIAANRCEKEEHEKKVSSPILKLKDDHKKQGIKILNKMGLPKDAWYVTLHARESGYKSENKKNTKENFRNSNPLNYLKAIEIITKSGGWVFRMGDASMTPLPKMKNLIDYACSEYKSEMMDIFLAATSKFCIGTPSGFFRIPRYFGVPVILTNCAYLSPYFSLKKGDLFIPRLLKNFQKIPFLHHLTSDKEYKPNKLLLTPNTEEEIYDVTLEMMNKVFQNKKENKETLLQKKFKNISEKNIFSSVDEKQKSYANIGANFIKKHEYLLND